MDWSTLNRTAVLSLPDRLSIEIERLIVDGTLPAGEKLPTERNLAESLGVSRVSVRQALHELENRGMIDRRPGRGTTVLSPLDAANNAGAAIAMAMSSDARDIRNIMELRSIIEPPIAALTATHATDRDIEQLRQLVDAMSVDMSAAKYAELDRSFHQTIAQYTHNPLLALLTEQIATFIAPSRNSALQSRKRRVNSTEQHRKILDAIAAHDPDAARQEATTHLAAVTVEILRLSAGATTSPESDV